MELCFYHKKQSIGHCEKCGHAICSNCEMIFSFPFSGTLISFGGTDFTEDKRIYCPSCYWKSVIEISTSWGLRLAHVFGLILVISFLFFYFEIFFEPMTSIIFFSAPPEDSDWLIISIYLFPIVFLFFLTYFSLFSL